MKVFLKKHCLDQFNLYAQHQVIYQPLSVLVMAFKKEEVKHALDGFGILIPSKEQANGFQTLGD